MLVSILHISDLHRDLKDEVPNNALVQSLENDFERFATQSPSIARPAICIVSGDLVYGVKPGASNVAEELQRQYDQAIGFLEELSERFFGGDRERIVILPGNHDVCYDDVKRSWELVEIPIDANQKRMLCDELFQSHSLLRWSWPECCFFRINDKKIYNERFRFFSEAYGRFYRDKRNFSAKPEEQFQIHDFADLKLSVAALNSCYNNDPLRRAGGLNPTALAEVCKACRAPDRVGWTKAAAWHHNLGGGPQRDDYIDAQFLQNLIEADISLGFHGHQHLHDCFDERYKVGPSPKKITIFSAGTLCGEPVALQPGVPRSYNIVEYDDEAASGRVHQRKMVNANFALPIWGPGHFDSSNESSVAFQMERPAISRPVQLDKNMALERVESLIGQQKWNEALEAIEPIRTQPDVRPFLVEALSRLGDDRQIIAKLWQPLSTAEIIFLGAAIVSQGTSEEAKSFVDLPIVKQARDASVREITDRVKQRFAL